MQTFILMFVLIVSVVILAEKKLKGGGKGGRPKGHKLKSGKGDQADNQLDKQPDKQPDK